MSELRGDSQGVPGAWVTLGYGVFGLERDARLRRGDPEAAAIESRSTDASTAGTVTGDVYTIICINIYIYIYIYSCPQEWRQLFLDR